MKKCYFVLKNDEIYDIILQIAVQTLKTRKQNFQITYYEKLSYY